ncbi:hypothetical protein TcBrA4_0083300 [Trypanosoma cruzi]|nr:hypothetical protein TcBrA4_0083300 [Trypanosoma cruzi]
MMSGVNMLCSDKTGTLTLNKMEIQDQCFTFEKGHDLRSVLVLAALAAKWREPPRDALDTMVLGLRIWTSVTTTHRLNLCRLIRQRSARPPPLWTSERTRSSA